MQLPLLQLTSDGAGETRLHGSQTDVTSALLPVLGKQPATPLSACA